MGVWSGLAGGGQRQGAGAPPRASGGRPCPAPCLDALDHVSHQALEAESPDGRDALSLLSEPDEKLITCTQLGSVVFLFCSFPTTRSSRG